MQKAPKPSPLLHTSHAKRPLSTLKKHFARKNTRKSHPIFLRKNTGQNTRAGITWARGEFRGFPSYNQLTHETLPPCSWVGRGSGRVSGRAGWLGQGQAGRLVAGSGSGWMAGQVRVRLDGWSGQGQAGWLASWGSGSGWMAGQIRARLDGWSVEGQLRVSWGLVEGQWRW